MGTRHLQTVISKDGEKKISQYGQWDGYPSGQGVDILNYLRTANLEKYHENLIKIPLLSDAKAAEIERNKNWRNEYPYLSRDCGSNIHHMIENGEVEFVNHIEESEAKKWCEGFYTIDFSKNEFTSEYYNKKKTFKLNKLPTVKRYLKIMEPPEE